MYIQYIVLYILYSTILCTVGIDCLFFLHYINSNKNACLGRKVKSPVSPKQQQYFAHLTHRKEIPRGWRYYFGDSVGGGDPDLNKKESLKLSKDKDKNLSGLVILSNIYTSYYQRKSARATTFLSIIAESHVALSGCYSNIKAQQDVSKGIAPADGSGQPLQSTWERWMKTSFC